MQGLFAAIEVSQMMSSRVGVLLRFKVKSDTGMIVINKLDWLSFCIFLVGNFYLHV